MNCVRQETLLREHAHGVPLSPALEAHLAGCAVCQDVLAAEQRLLSEIDRALDGVGRVEPSPTFLARARGIAADPSRRSMPSARLASLRWWLVWALPALAGALLIAALVARRSILVEPTSGVASSSSPPPFATRRSPAPVTAPPESRATSLPSKLPRPTASREAADTRHTSTRPPLSEPPVIVPPGQADALVRLATLIDTGSIAPPTLLLQPPDPTQEIRQPADVSFRPLTIAPIVAEGADEEGDTL